MAFRIGQKVVCVDDSPVWTTGEIMLARGATYTVCAVSEPKNFCIAHGRSRRDQGIKIHEVMIGETEWFDPRRFAIITEKSTDTGFAILEEIRRAVSRELVT